MAKQDRPKEIISRICDSTLSPFQRRADLLRVAESFPEELVAAARAVADTDDDDLRLQACRLLADRFGEDVEDVVVAFLRDRDDRVRSQAARILGTAGSARCVGPLSQAREDLSPVVREAAQESLTVLEERGLVLAFEGGSEPSAPPLSSEGEKPWAPDRGSLEAPGPSPVDGEDISSLRPSAWEVPPQQDDTADIPSFSLPPKVPQTSPPSDASPPSFHNPPSTEPPSLLAKTPTAPVQTVGRVRLPLRTLSCATLVVAVLLLPVILIAVIMLSARENNRLDIHRRPIGPRDYGTGDSPDVRQKREEERKKRAAEAKRFIEKARIAFMEGDFRTVVRCAREGTRKAPGLWRGYRLAGLGLLALGSNDSAAFQFNEACRLISDPSESPRLPLLFAAASRLARQKYAHEDFLRLAKRFERDELYDLYEGRISAEEIVASLPPSSRRRGQNPFYAGLYLLGGQDKAKALALLRKGLEFLDKSSQEAVLARALLKRYGGGD